MVGKKAACAMVASVGEWRRGMPPARLGGSVGERGEISEGRFISGTAIDRPVAPFRSEDDTDPVPARD